MPLKNNSFPTLKETKDKQKISPTALKSDYWTRLQPVGISNAVKQTVTVLNEFVYQRGEVIEWYP